MSDMVIGRNACLEAMKAGRKIDALIILRDQKKGIPAKGPIGEIIRKAEEMGIPVESVSRSEMDRLASGAVHQGVMARVEPYAYSSVDDIIAFAQERGESPFIVLLDGIEDPHNLGAIMRTAECAGAHGVVIPKNRAAEVNETVLRTSAGAAEHIRCARVTNLSRTIDELKEKGIWIFACDMGEAEIWDTDMTGAIAVVIGSEGRGVSRLVKEHSDGIISLPLRGKVNSLNASNAAAVALYEVVRQRRMTGE